MGDLLSQAEIDALLSNASMEDDNTSSKEADLSTQEIDALGEIGNISMGTASTTLFTLIGQKVLITTPKVDVTTWGEVTSTADGTYVAVRTEFIHGLMGTNLLILKEKDVKVIADLMMGGDGTNTDGELTDLHLSAIGEAMNQMIGSSATSMASIINKRIEISAPKAFKLTMGQDDFSDFNKDQKIIKISFKTEIGNLVNSEIMQLLPIDFAREMVAGLLTVEDDIDTSSSISDSVPIEQNETIEQSIQQTAAAQYAPPQNYQMEPPAQQQTYNQMFQQEQPSQEYVQIPSRPANQNHVHMTPNNPEGAVNVQPVQYQNFDEGRGSSQKENIGLLMDVPLQITVELGRTQKLIRDILEFAPGSIIELDKLAGEQVDILVNGKAIAKGEVVIIDESFGVRVTDIVQPSKRI